jgi:enoyl-CoA hydratase
MSTQLHSNSKGVETDHEYIQYEVSSNVATIWLNRPEVKNCVNWELLVQMGEAVERAGADEDVRVVLFRGRGNTFCAGADLNMLDGEFLSTSTKSIELAQRSARTYDAIFNLSKPTVAVVEGYAVAGGFELLISTDFVVAADEASIGDFHIRRALFGGAGPIYRLPRMIGIRKTKELMLTGKLLSGKEAVDFDLINASAPAAELDQLVADFIAPLADKSPFMMRLTKMTIDRGLDADIQSLMVMEHLAVGNALQSEDAKEGVQAFLEKREPKWVGR